MITHAELQNKSAELYPAVFLEKFSTYYSRRLISKIIFWLMFVAFLAVLILQFIPAEHTDKFWFLVDYKYQIRSLFFVLLSFWLLFQLTKAFYFSYYFREASVDFEVAKLVINCNTSDLTKSFLRSQIGLYTMMRLGLGSDQINKFLTDRQHFVSADDFDIDINSKERNYINLRDYAGTLYEIDDEFSYFLSLHKIDKETFIGALEWFDDIEWKVRSYEKWWDKANLSRIQGVGRNWSFGKIYLLEKFGQSIMADQIYLDLGDRWRMFEKDVQKVESVLVKHRDANVVLVAPTTSIAMQIIASLGKMILYGKVLFEIEDKRIFILDTVALIDSVKDIVQLERLIRNILFEADKVGNVILVIPNLPVFNERASEIGVDVSNLLSDFLRSSRLQIIALADNRGYHESVESNTGIMQYFEKVLIEDIDKNSAIKLLQNEANRIEVRDNVFFTYQTIKAIAEGADRYFVGMTYSDKIVDLIDEIVVKVKTDGRKIITVEDAQYVISKKTGVPQGEISEEEKVKLKNLEQILHQRIVGQELAIDAVSDTMRRSRSGIADHKRPMGSFLFIGPTGVGKTETVKALNEIFFNNTEDKIIRLDMSEYNGEDAIEKLIGSYASGTRGILASKIRDQQYGVLLLDEFEKTTDKVKDLFLQILDEGQFTDSQGEKINCRNLIIVATSNAGSDLIFKVATVGGDLSKMREPIIHHIVEQRIFRPELLNRFDSIVLFHSLEKEHLRKVATIMLDKLNKRLHQNGLKIKIDDALIDYLIKIGSNPEFGAREMNRKIKEEIESLIADKIISDEIRSGDLLIFKFDENEKPDLISEKNIE